MFFNRRPGRTHCLLTAIGGRHNKSKGSFKAAARTKSMTQQISASGFTECHLFTDGKYPVFTQHFSYSLSTTWSAFTLQALRSHTHSYTDGSDDLTGWHLLITHSWHRRSGFSVLLKDTDVLTAGSGIEHLPSTVWTMGGPFRDVNIGWYRL